MLANLRYFGHIFNPVAFYYCHGASEEETEAVIASVKRFPRGEQLPYVLARGGRTGPVLSDEMPKAEASMSRVLARHPAMTMQVVGRIYAQALRLKLKGAKSFPHPHDARPKPRGLTSP